MNRVRRALQSLTTVYAACGVSLAIGLFFIFVWAPHPWSWEGFDHYHDLALTLATGHSFPTLDVPWGYAYFLAFFYRLFGDHPAVPLTVQAAANAAIPFLTYRFASGWLDRESAIAAAALTGVLSFNTVYASTQSSDAICTVLFMLASVSFATALGSGRDRRYAASGALLGLAAQFRPNLILLPVVLSAFVVFRRVRHWPRHAIVLATAAALMLTPWIVRNYRLTRELLPTSVHGGVQLWYGTLQVGPYLHSRAHNPRSVFEGAAFDYTSLTNVPLIVSAMPKACAPGAPDRVTLTYWTDRTPSHVTLVGMRAAQRFVFEMPPPNGDAVVYYHFTVSWPDAGEVSTPAMGAGDPFVYFVTGDHLGDQDVHGDLVDIFDLVRAGRAAAWHEPVPNADRLHAAQIAPDDPKAITALLATSAFPPDDRPAAVLVHTENAESAVNMHFADGSSIVVPKQWSGRITDLGFAGSAALALMHAHVRVAAVSQRRHAFADAQPCRELEEILVNDVFYRHEPHLMRRYAALAWDNIRRNPAGFAAATAFRASRVFVISGSDDPFTTQQFAHSAVIYVAATAVTLASFVLFVAGVVTVWRRHGQGVVLPLLLVVYVPLTLAPVLTNMRYSVTVQPIVLTFIAAALVAAFESLRSRTALAP